MSALRNLLAEIVDYAGLFPPAGLPMDQAVKNYADYVQSNNAWMLGRFVVPAAKLDAFENAATDLLPKSANAKAWHISALMPPVDTDDDGFLTALQRVNAFNQSHAHIENGFAIVDSLEVKADTVDQIQDIAGFELPEGECFVELDHRSDPDELIAVLQQHVGGGLRAKIRTGGVEEPMIPAPDEVARFIARCAQHKVAFKATAGLHHPIRNQFPLTYETGAACATMHGFLNVFVASCLAWETSGQDVDAIARVLSAESIDSITIDDSSIQIDGHTFDMPTIELIRSSFARSFGSCSFVEPLEDLESLGVMQLTGSV